MAFGGHVGTHISKSHPLNPEIDQSARFESLEESMGDVKKANEKLAGRIGTLNDTVGMVSGEMEKLQTKSIHFFLKKNHSVCMYFSPFCHPELEFFIDSAVKKTVLVFKVTCAGGCKGLNITVKAEEGDPDLYAK